MSPFYRRTGSPAGAPAARVKEAPRRRARSGRGRDLPRERVVWRERAGAAWRRVGGLGGADPGASTTRSPDAAASAAGARGRTPEETPDSARGAGRRGEAGGGGRRALPSPHCRPRPAPPLRGAPSDPRGLGFQATPNAGARLPAAGGMGPTSAGAGPLDRGGLEDDEEEITAATLRGKPRLPPLSALSAFSYVPPRRLDPQEHSYFSRQSRVSRTGQGPRARARRAGREGPPSGAAERGRGWWTAG